MTTLTAAHPEAANPAANYQTRLSRALWFRHPTRPNRFLFAPASPTGLFIEPLGKAGATTFVTLLKTMRGQGLTVSAGALLVDEDGRFVFCGGTLSPELLGQLAGWAKQHISQMPALANLLDSGVAKVAIDLANDEAIKAIDLKKIESYRDAAVWGDLLQPTAATVASVLEARLPGERMWYWLSADVPEESVPLLVQPVAWDPNRDRLDHLIRQAEAFGVGEAATGTCMVVDDGRLQFLGSELGTEMLPVLADWVRANVGQHPGLARLWNCQLLRTAEGSVREVLEDVSVWNDVPRPIAPGTLAETASLLEKISGETEAWFWMTAAGNNGPFLGLARADTDADGVEFKERVAAFYKRFPDSFKDALTGLVRRLPSGELLFSSQDASVDHWPGVIHALVERQATAYPGLAPLAGATLVQIQDGKVGRTLTAAEIGYSSGLWSENRSGLGQRPGLCEHHRQGVATIVCASQESNRCASIPNKKSPSSKSVSAAWTRAATTQ